MSVFSTQRRAELALIGVTLIWGWTFVVVKQALVDASTLVFIALRFLLAAAVLWLLLARAFPASGPVRRLSLRVGLLAGACLFAGYFFQTLGLRYTTASKSAFITGLTTVLVPFLAAALYRKPPQMSEWMGVALAFAGLALLTLPPGRLALSFGDALTLCCAFAFAFHILVLDRWAARCSIPLLSVAQISLTGLLSLALCGWVETPVFSWSPFLAFAVVLTGVLATALALTVQTWAQQHTSPARTALIFALEPVAAAAAAALLAGEHLGRRALAGAALILAGVLFVELKPLRLRRHPLV